MRCKKHFNDLSSVDGVCAACLRERLLIVIEAQNQADLKAQGRKHHDHEQIEFEFPRSVSPYVTCRKSDNNAADDGGVRQHHHGHSLSDQRFYSTPQIVYRKKQDKFSLIPNFFRSKKESDPNCDPKPRESCVEASPSWMSSMFPKKTKKSRMFTLSDPNASRVSQRPCRGMSPAEESEDESDAGCSSESSPRWKETPQRAAATVQSRCKRLNQARNLTGFAFCLSPMVRPGINRKTENSVAGDVRIPVKPHIGLASTYCANRSKKLADCGRRFHPSY